MWSLFSDQRLRLMNNLAQRTVSGFILAAIMVCACLLGPLFPVLGAFAIGWTMHEYYSMAYGHSGDFIPERILAVFSALTVFGLLNFILRGMLAFSCLRFFLCLL